MSGRKRQRHDPEIPACLPGEEPLVDLDTFQRAGRLLLDAAPTEDSEPAD